ncbi:MAG: PCMD domain-containing protein, partial [Bacteroidaceae bacterium]|nr:PCMD domain-containing protein [Bacteroidaceae bacterium]
ELEQSQTVGEWTQCTITLDYRSLDRIPTYIVLTASASKYGDYFAGSTSSVLYLDDMELIYE